LRRPLLFALAAAVPLLLYARTADFGFAHADDADLIAANQAFLANPRNVPRAFEKSYFEVEGQPSDKKTYYRPVTIVSFMLDAQRSGANPHAYHVTNIVLHAAATCLVFALALAWGAPEWAALAAALVFAVHPINVQAVAWIAGRNDLLSAVFGIISMIAIATTRSATALAVAIHAAAFAVALFSKETAIVFPLIALFRQRVVAGERLTRAHWVALTLDAVVVAVWTIGRTHALGGLTSDISDNPLREALVNSPQLFMHAGKMLVPLRLNVSPSVDVVGVALGAIAIIAFALVFWRWMDWRAAALVVVSMLGFLLPTLLVPGLPVYEHRAYLPLISVVTTLAIATPMRVVASRYAILCVTLICLVFGTIAYERQRVFRDPFTYWTDGSRDAQFGPIADVNLGQLYEAAGRPSDARREYLRALERSPATPKAHNNLGVVLMTLGEADLAREHFRIETERHPANPEGWFNLGLWSEERGDSAAARRYFQRAVAADSHFAPAREKLER
jgi:protein O-mannosyl-transferase